MTSLHRYCAVAPAELDLAEGGEPVDIGDRTVEHHVQAFPSVEALLASDRVMRACYTYADERPRFVSFDADPAAALQPDPEEYEGVFVRAQAVHTDVALRDWLERAGSDPALRGKARELLMRIEQSQPTPDEAEEEFRDAPYEEPADLMECWTLALRGEDVLRARERPWVEGRELPRGFRKLYWTPEALLRGELATEASTDAPALAQVVEVRVREDQVVVPTDLDPDDRQALYARPHEVVSTSPFTDWLSRMRAADPERADELLELIAG
jgi:hypothetical protein